MLQKPSSNSTTSNVVFLTREALSKRWGITTRTIDRQRILGLLPWRDLSNGIGKRPIVRFKLSDIEEYEKKVLQTPHGREG
jgi:hypothetical protein